MRQITIVSPTFNEQDNVVAFYSRVNKVMEALSYDYSFLFIDNGSTDSTRQVLLELAKGDSKVKLIFNETNFGHLRSPYYALLQTDSDATILLASDLQDPPEIIPALVAKWEARTKVVLAVKSSSSEFWLMDRLRRSYYRMLENLSASPMVRNATGAGIFDRDVITTLRTLNEPYPYFRGLVSELGFKVETVEFHQPKRVAGKTKNSFLTLYDLAILGLTTHGGSFARVVSLAGLTVAGLSLAVAVFYLVMKVLYWDTFELGLAPLVIGFFVFSSMQIFLLGFIGEYLANLMRRVRNLPLVIEAERVNF